MAALLGFDGASAFDLAAAKKAGAIVATVYIVGTPGGMPHADKARVAAIRAKGLGALPNWERAAAFFETCTVAEAKAAGVEALGACRALGFPDDGSVGCAFSFDVDVPVSRFPEMGRKVDAVTSGLGGHYVMVVYAQQALIDYLIAHGHLAGKQWLMASTFGELYHPGSPNVCMVQGHDVAGNWIQDTDPVSGTDINTVTDPSALPAWWPDNSPFGGSMPFTSADLDEFWDHEVTITTVVGEKTAAVKTFLGNADVFANHAAAQTDTVEASLAALTKAVAALQASQTAVQAAVSKLEMAGVDPVAVAQAIAAHVKLEAM